MPGYIQFLIRKKAGTLSTYYIHSKLDVFLQKRKYMASEVANTDSRGLFKDPSVKILPGLEMENKKRN